MLGLTFLFFADDDSHQGGVSKLSTEEQAEDEEEEADEEEHNTDGDEGQMETEDEGAALSADGEEGRGVRSGSMAERTESRAYGSVTHKCEVSCVSVW